MTAQTLKIDLEHGEAEISSYVTRKAGREWKLVLWEDHKIVSNSDGKDKVIFSEQSKIKADDVFVLNMLVKLNYNEKTFEGDQITQEALNQLSEDDFDKIAIKCFAIKAEKLVDKKKSLNKPKE